MVRGGSKVRPPSSDRENRTSPVYGLAALAGVGHVQLAAGSDRQLRPRFAVRVDRLRLARDAHRCAEGPSAVGRAADEHVLLPFDPHAPEHSVAVGNHHRRVIGRGGRGRRCGMVVLRGGGVGGEEDDQCERDPALHQRLQSISTPAKTVRGRPGASSRPRCSVYDALSAYRRSPAFNSRAKSRTWRAASTWARRFTSAWPP